MADNDPKLGIEFVLKQSGDGAQKTAQEISDVSKAAKEAAPAAEELSKKTDKTTESAKEAVKAKKDWLAQLRVLSREIPGLHLVMDLVKNPIVAAAAAVTFFVSALKTLLNEIQTMEQRMAVFDRLTLKAGKFHEVAAQMDSAEKTFRRALDSIAEGAGNALKNLDAVNAALERQKRFMDEEQDSQMALELAKVDQAEAGGRMSKAGAIQARARIRAAAEERKVQGAAAERGLGIEARETAIFGLQGEEAVLEQRRQQAMEELRKARLNEATKKDFADKSVADSQKELDRLAAEKTKVQAQITEWLPSVTGGSRILTPGEPMPPATRADIRRQHVPLDKALTRLDEINAAMEQQAGLREGARKIQVDASMAREDAEARVSDIQSGITARRSRRTALEGEVGELRREDTMQRDLGPARGRRAQAASIRAGVEVDSAAAEEARKWFEAYQQLNKDMAAVLRAAIENANMTKEQVRAELDRLQRQFDARVNQAESQFRNGRL